MAKHQFNLKTLLLATCIIALVISGMMAVVNRRKQVREATRSSHATQLVAFMCVDHMISNNQNWPAGWDDLKDDFKVNPAYIRYGQRGEPAWTRSDLKRRVKVDWKPDLDLLKNDSGCKPLIWISNDKEREMQKHLTIPEEMLGPNAIVRGHVVLTEKLADDIANRKPPFR